jgi:hypothetical protein
MVHRHPRKLARIPGSVVGGGRNQSRRDGDDCCRTTISRAWTVRISGALRDRRKELLTARSSMVGTFRREMGSRAGRKV